jgi:hypothetical protein
MKHLVSCNICGVVSDILDCHFESPVRRGEKSYKHGEKKDLPVKRRRAGSPRRRVRNVKKSFCHIGTEVTGDLKNVKHNLCNTLFRELPTRKLCEYNGCVE